MDVERWAFFISSKLANGPASTAELRPHRGLSILYYVLLPIAWLETVTGVICYWSKCNLWWLQNVQSKLQDLKVSPPTTKWFGTCTKLQRQPILFFIRAPLLGNEVPNNPVPEKAITNYCLECWIKKHLPSGLLCPFPWVWNCPPPLYLQWQLIVLLQILCLKTHHFHFQEAFGNQSIYL